MIHVPVVLIIGSIEQRNTSHYWYPKAPPPTPKRIQASLLLEGLLGSDLGRVATLPLSLFVTCSSARQHMSLGSQNIRSWWHGEGDGRSTFGRFACHTAKLVRHVSFHVTIQAQLTLYLEARALREGSMIPPRRRRTRWRVDSFWMSVNDADVSTAITSASKPIIPFFPRLSYNIHPTGAQMRPTPGHPRFCSMRFMLLLHILLLVSPFNAE